jgi:hypothetical protein
MNGRDFYAVRPNTARPSGFFLKVLHPRNDLRFMFAPSLVQAMAGFGHFKPANATCSSAVE